MNFRKPLLAAILLSLSALPASAQNNTGAGGAGLMSVAPIYLYKSAGLPQFISAGTLASATGLTVPALATIAQICVETAPVRYRDDGVAPTATVGMLWPVGCNPYAGPLKNVQFIAASGSPTMDVSYYVAN